MLRVVNIILIISVSLGLYYFYEPQSSEKQKIVEIYPGDTGDEYDELVEIFGSEKASTE